MCVAPRVLGSLLESSDQHKFRNCVPGHKVLNCGWEWGRESLPLSLPHSVTTSAPTRLALKELSLPAIFKTSAGEGVEEEGAGVEKEKGEASDCRETAPGTLSPGTWPRVPNPKRGPALPRVVLSSPALPPLSSFASLGGWAARFPAKPWLPAQFFQTLQSGKAGALSG